MSAYAVGKAAQETLLAAVAREVAGTGVTVNVLRVRAIDTNGVRERDPHGQGRHDDDARPRSRAAIRYLFSDAGRRRQRRAHRICTRGCRRNGRRRHGPAAAVPLAWTAGPAGPAAAPT